MLYHWRNCEVLERLRISRGHENSQYIRVEGRVFNTKHVPRSSDRSIRATWEQMYVISVKAEYINATRKNVKQRRVTSLQQRQYLRLEINDRTRTHTKVLWWMEEVRVHVYYWLKADYQSTTSRTVVLSHTHHTHAHHTHITRTYHTHITHTSHITHMYITHHMHTHTEIIYKQRHTMVCHSYNWLMIMLRNVDILAHVN